MHKIADKLKHNIRYLCFKVRSSKPSGEDQNNTSNKLSNHSLAGTGKHLGIPWSSGTAAGEKNAKNNNNLFVLNDKINSSIRNLGFWLSFQLIVILYVFYFNSEKFHKVLFGLAIR